MGSVPKQDFLVGRAIAEFRRLRGLTQRELAERAGVVAGTLGAVERGWIAQPSDEFLRKVAAALEVEPVALGVTAVAS